MAEITHFSAKHQLPSLRLATSTTSAQCDPATLKQGKSELGACLTLVSPSGLTANDRTEWLAVAMQTLSGIPADLLARGCKQARETCRFPSEIVPAIMNEARDEWARRDRNARIEAAQYENRHAPRLEQQEPEYVAAEEMRKLIRSLGL